MRRKKPQSNLIFLIPLCILIGALGWYYFVDRKANLQSNESPIGFVKNFTNEVQQKPKDKFLWFQLKEWEPIYSGVSIKTAADAELKIQLNHSENYLVLESDTEVQISQQEDQLIIQITKGNLLASVTNRDNRIYIQNKSQMYELSMATAQFITNKNKNQENANSILDVQVLKGKVWLITDNQRKEIAANSKNLGIEILSPTLEQTQYTNPENPEPIIFKWKGFLAGSQVSLWLGTNRNNLVENPLTKVSSSDFISINIPAGKYFYQLVAKDPSTDQILQSSPISRLEVNSLSAPTVINPLANFYHFKDPANPLTEFRWTNPENIQSVSLDVALDADFKNKVIQENLGLQTSFRKFFNDGEYFWKLTVIYPNINKTISTNVFKITISSKPKNDRPQLTINWVSPADNSIINFGNEPIANFNWTTNDRNQVKSWRIKVASDIKTLQEDQPGNVKSFTSKDTNIKIPFKKDGTYAAVIEALDEKQQILNKSSFKEFKLVAAPLLAAPDLLPLDGDFQGDKQGKVNLNWKRVPGAFEYWITLYTQEGREIASKIDKNKDIEITTLLPGTHKIDIYAVDSFGRKSQRKPPRIIKIPDGSSIRAPTGIRIKK